MVTFREAVKSDLQQIAVLHENCFENSLTTALGHELLMKLYGTYLDLKLPFIVGVDKNGKVIALCQGVLNRLDVHSIFEQKYRTQLAKKIISLCLKLNRLAIKKVFLKVKSKLKRKVQKSNSQELQIENEASITSICVLEEYRGKTSNELLAYYENYLKNIGIKKLNLHVLKENGRAIAFYEKNGFKKWYELSDSLAYVKTL